MLKIGFFIVLSVVSLQSIGQSIFKETMRLMGCDFGITVVSKNHESAKVFTQQAVDEIQRIENLISSWDPNSQTSKINQNAGKKPVQVEQELFQLIQRALRISKLTDGAFDISYASMDFIWQFDGSMSSMPTASQIESSVAKVGFENIVLNKEKNTVFLKKKGMKIGFGAIGKGYAADRAKALLKSQGVEAGIINASGDMNTWGVQPDGSSWKVAITNPMDKNKSFGVLPISNKAVVTSGDYEKFVQFNGVRYSHIINPKTGYPATGIISVTVFAPQAEIADALATSIFVMGVDVGLNRINQLPQIECVIVDDKGNVQVSENIKIDNL